MIRDLLRLRIGHEIPLARVDLDDLDRVLVLVLVLGPVEELGQAFVDVCAQLDQKGARDRLFRPAPAPVIGEFPDEKAAASAVLAAAGGGSLSDVETTVAMTAKDAFATFESAGKPAKAFRSAGRS